MDDLFEFGQRIVKAQPFCGLLGVRLVSFENGLAEFELDLAETLKQHHGFAHGGVISALADLGLAFAGGSVLGDAVTSEYKINYARPAIGDKLIARASVLHSGRSQAICQCEISALNAGEEKTVAFAQGTIAKVQSKNG